MEVLNYSIISKDVLWGPINALTLSVFNFKIYLLHLFTDETISFLGLRHCGTDLVQIHP